jgi:hypothetical protein
MEAWIRADSLQSWGEAIDTAQSYVGLHCAENGMGHGMSRFLDRQAIFTSGVVPVRVLQTVASHQLEEGGHEPGRKAAHQGSKQQQQTAHK